MIHLLFFVYQSDMQIRFVFEVLLDLNDSSLCVTGFQGEVYDWMTLYGRGHVSLQVGADAEDGDAEIRHKVCRVEMTG